MSGAALMLRENWLQSTLKWVSLAGMVLVISSCSSSEEKAQSYYENGLKLAAAGEPVKAGLEFRNALKLNDALIDALFQLGLVEEQQGHFDTAARIFVSVAEKDPQHALSRVRLAYILLAAGQADQALKYAEQAREVAPQDQQAVVAMAAVQLRLDNRGEAKSLAGTVLESDPQQVDALMVLAAERILASDLSGALDLLNKAPIDSETNVGLQLLRLSVLDALDDQPSVEALLKKLSQLFDGNSAFPLSLVNWYVSKGRLKDAEAAMRQFAADHPNDNAIQSALIEFLNLHRGPEVALATANEIVAARERGGESAFAIRMVIGQLQFDAGQQVEAMTSLRSIITNEVNSANRNSARIQLARMAASQKDWTAAETIVNTVLEDDSKSVEALRIRASVRLMRGETDKAIDDLLVAVNEAPNDVQLLTFLAGAYERKGMTAVAGDQYAKAMTLDQKSPETGLAYARFLIQYGRADQAMNIVESVRLRFPQDRQVLTLLGQQKLNAQDWVGAEQVAKELRELDDNADKGNTADRIMAAALGGQNKYQESIRLLRSTLTANANSPEVLADLVRTYIAAGDLNTAETLLKKTIADNPENVEARILIGSVYSISHRKDLAEQALKEAAAADNDGQLGSAALSQFYLSTGNAAAAESTAVAALERNGNNAVLRSILGALYQQQEKFEEAIAQYELIFAANPESTAAANDLASLLSERRSDPASLERAFEIAQRFQTSQTPQFLDTLGWIYYLRGEYAASLPLLKTAADRLPNVALIQLHLGMALKELGQHVTAKAKLEEAVSLSPPLIGRDLEKAKNALQQLQQAISASGGSTDIGRNQ